MNRPTVLVLLASTRREGFTSQLLDGAAEVIERECNLERVNLFDYDIRPCLGCFKCLEGKGCVQKDSMGRSGDLLRLIHDSNAILLGTPVYHWTYNSITHAFLERLYPTHWDKMVNGMPCAFISCASNQGFQSETLTSLCKMGFALNLKYVCGADCHAAFMDEEMPRARLVGKYISEAAKEDFLKGRSEFTELEKWSHYMSKIWNPFTHYLGNITDQRLEVRKSLPERLLSKSDNDDSVINLLEKCTDNLERSLSNIKSSNGHKALELLIEASIQWTEATWQKIVKGIVKREMPKTYRDGGQRGNLK